MKIAVISDTTYPACLPWDDRCQSYYGSEPYHALLAHLFYENGHDVHFYAPLGSTRIGTFHPLKLTLHQFLQNDSLEQAALDPARDTIEELATMDFVIDMSASCSNVEQLKIQYNYDRYLCYRNGYQSFNAPLLPRAERHYVVPSRQNQAIFQQLGKFDAAVCYYGIPDFYCPGSDDSYFLEFAQEHALRPKSYFLFTHRPTVDKGIHTFLELAQRFPSETFVIATGTTFDEHKQSLSQAREAARERNLKNLRFVDLPLNPKHHYYKRELMRRAKALVSAFGPNYVEGFGLANAECVASGTPIIISDSPSTRELWRDVNQSEPGDAVVVSGISGFVMAARFFDHFQFKCVNRYPTSQYYARYLELLRSLP